MGHPWVALAMALAAGATLGCVLIERPRRPGSVLTATTMLLAMADMALGHLIIPVAWAGVLISLGVFVVTLPSTARTRCGWQHGVALVAAAMIMLGSPHALPAAGAAGPGHVAHQGPSLSLGAGWSLGLVIALGYLVVVSAPLLRPAVSRLDRPADGAATGASTRPAVVVVSRTQVLQIASTMLCLALMAVLPLTV